MKVLSVLLALVVLAGLLVGCGQNQQSTSDVPDSSQIDNSADNSAEETSGNTSSPDAFSSDINDPFESSENEVDYKGYFEVVKRYQGYEDEFNEGYYYLVVKNNTSEAIYIEALITAKDSSGKILKKERAEYECVGSGETSFDYVIFDARFSDPFDEEYPGPTNADDIADIDVDIQYVPISEIPDYYEEHDYLPVVSGLEAKKYENKDKRNIVITVKNHNKYNAYMPEAHILFFDKDNNVISHQSILFADEDRELKSGETQFGATDVYIDYDHAELYFAGHSDGSTKKHTAACTLEDIEIVKEIDVAYSGENENIRVLRYLVIKNNSKVDAEIECSSIAWGKDKRPLSVGGGSIYVLGPGKTSILSIMYSAVLPEEIVSVDDSFYFKTEALNYTDILGSLSYEFSASDGGLTLSVTNNGNETASSVFAHIFLYNSEGELIDYQCGYLVDDDLEIKAGATESKEFETGVAFDKVEVYLTGTSVFKSAYND